MRLLLLTCLALVTACGDGRLDTSRFGACAPRVLDGLSPAVPYDGLELRELCIPSRHDLTGPAPTVDASVSQSYGTSCSTSTCADRVAELDRLHAPSPPPDFSPRVSCETYLIAMKDGAVVAVGDSPDTLRSILGAIDTADEAQLYAQFHGANCNGIQAVPGGYDILTSETYGDCPQSVRRIVIRVGADGSYGIVESEPWQTVNACT